MGVRCESHWSPGPPQPLSQKREECPAGLALSPCTDAVPRQLGWECTKPQRWQWTWLGHAERQFGDCILHVSTLQMKHSRMYNSIEVGVGAVVG